MIKRTDYTNNVTGFVKVEITKSKRCNFLCWEFSLEEVAGEIILSDFSTDQFPLSTSAKDMHTEAEKLIDSKQALMNNAFSNWIQQ